MVAAVGGCVVLFSSLLLAALLLHLRRRQEHKYLRQVLTFQHLRQVIPQVPEMGTHKWGDFIKVAC